MIYYFFASNLVFVGVTLLLWENYQTNLKIEECTNSLIEIQNSIIKFKIYIEKLEEELEDTKKRNKELSEIIREQKDIVSD